MVVYELDPEQNEKINSTWEWIRLFSNGFGQLESGYDSKGMLLSDWWTIDGQTFDVSLYRHYIIRKIRKKYTPEQFYTYEQILNKLFWNLKIKLSAHVKDNSTQFVTVKNPHTEKNLNFHTSDINSIVHYNYRSREWFVLKKLSRLDEICMDIMRSHESYYKYISNPSLVRDYGPTLKVHHHLNYPFPNVNPMFFNSNIKTIWMEKINRLYYYTGQPIDKYWYRIIHVQVTP